MKTKYDCKVFVESYPGNWERVDSYDLEHEAAEQAAKHAATLALGAGRDRVKFSEGLCLVRVIVEEEGELPQGFEVDMEPGIREFSEVDYDATKRMLAA
jgi:hypothetical protein